MTMVLLDLEGTLVSGKAFEPISGAASLVDGLRAKNIMFRIVTNNTTDAPQSLVEKLNSVGIGTKQNELISALGVLGETLAPTSRVYAIGAPAMFKTLQALGHYVNEGGRCQAVVIGGGGDLSTQILSEACRAIMDDGANLVGLHKNRLYVDERGQRTVGVGAIVTALEYATNAKSTIVGKPSEYFFGKALSGFSGPNGDVWCVSDDPYSDLVGARDLGMKTIFVTTGKYSASECSKLGWTPTAVLSTLSEVAALIANQ